jgi:hypothetical protein
MQPSIRVGLIVGVIGLVLALIGSAFSGICGLVLPLLISGVAGYSSVQREKALSKGDGARDGAIAGAIAAGIASHARILAQVIVTALIENLPAFSIVSDTFNATEQIFFYVMGLTWAVFIGGIVGAVAGYVGTSDKPDAPPMPME